MGRAPRQANTSIGMKVLFIGPDSGTSLHRYRAFSRLGHDVRAVDPRKLLPAWNIIDNIEWKLTPFPLAAIARRKLLRSIAQESFDLAFVDSGSLISSALVRDLKARGMRVVNFNHDDPFGPRDGVRFAAYRDAIKDYDLVVVVRTENIAEAEALGASKVLYRYRVADDVEHAPRTITPEIRRKWQSDVAFVGTWMPERGPFLARLMAQGIPIAIYGSGWHKAPEWRTLRGALRAPHLEGDDYCYAVQCARVCLGLLSSGNRDLHTTRSMEIPSLGSVLCAKRTHEHESIYTDREEAVFWDDAEDCARQCEQLLQDESYRERIARQGRARFLQNDNTTMSLLRHIIDDTFASS